MRTYILVLCTILVLSAGSVVTAQDGSEICSPSDISARVAEAVALYEDAQASATDSDSALDELFDLQDRLENIQELCANVIAPESESQGTGTLQDPYKIGTTGDTGDGFSLQVTGVIRPADQAIRNANMFNDRAGEGQMYIIVQVTVECDRDNNGRCETSYFDYELVGDSGTIYEAPFVVYDNELDASLFAGGTATGELPFLIRADDTNLRLLYRSNMFRDDYVAYEAMPSAQSGVEITSSANINVRSGPGTNFGVTASLPANQSEMAFGRNSDGTWLQLSSGWVFAELVTINGDIERLPVTAQ